MSFEKQKVSVITVVLNDAQGIEKTTSGVLSQDYEPVELIIVDGGSTDGTWDIIKKNGDKIKWWVSKPDKGIYDAMNKGLEQAGGEWVIFLNSGDTFYETDTLSKIFAKPVPEDTGIIYGDYVADYGSYKVYRKSGKEADLWKGMIFCHQSIIIHTRLIKDRGYDLQYLLAADYDMICRLFSDGWKFLYFPRPVAICNASGRSNQFMVKACAEHYNIIRKYRKLTFTQRHYYSDRKLLLAMIMFAYRIFPKGVISALIKIFNRNHIVNNS
jgi:glycosyltransferase involved in cell wall biosynthesis